MTANGMRSATWRRTTLAAALGAVGLCLAASASADSDSADLTVVNRETGQPPAVWRFHGRLFIAGEPGVRYSLRVTNRTGGRAMMVMSVDGLNILTGETASYGQNGYVLHPYETYDATGWRKSDTEVAAFAFAPLPQSYAARTGRPADVGVIGLAVFAERPPIEARAAPTPPSVPFARSQGRPEPIDRDVAAPAAAAALPAPAPPPPPPAAPPPSGGARTSMAEAVVAAPRAERLGTAHGAREWSTVVHTEFERATAYPQSVVRIEYDTYANLVARGVIPRSDDPRRRPRPFPSAPDGAGYVPDPPPGS